MEALILAEVEQKMNTFWDVDSSCSMTLHHSQIFFQHLAKPWHSPTPPVLEWTSKHPNPSHLGGVGVKPLKHSKHGLQRFSVPGEVGHHLCSCYDGHVPSSMNMRGNKMFIILPTNDTSFPINFFAWVAT